MNSKQIRVVLSRKFHDFLKSIDNKNVKDLVEKNTIITGGAIPSLLLNEKVNDIDIYFTDFETVLEVTKYYLEKFSKMPPKRCIKDPMPESIYYRIDKDTDQKDRVRIVIQSSGVIAESTPEYNYFEGEEDQNKALQFIADLNKTLEEPKEGEEKPKYRPVFLSDNAITLTNGVQIIIRFYGDAEEIHKNYDFTHCTNYWTSKDNKLVLRPEALESLITKKLKYIGSKYPLCSIIRIRKFVLRGWNISAGEILKIAFNLNKFNLQNIEVLKEQLIGVDVAYFNELLRLLEDNMKKSDTKIVDETYLAELIEKVFS